MALRVYSWQGLCISGEALFMKLYFMIDIKKEINL